MNLVDHVKAELVRLETEASAHRRALVALRPNMPVEPVKLLVASRARKAKTEGGTGGTRGPDSELTRAKKRVGSAKRWGREPAQSDLDLVATNAGATSADKAAE